MHVLQNEGNITRVSVYYPSFIKISRPHAYLIVIPPLLLLRRLRQPSALCKVSVPVCINNLISYRKSPAKRTRMGSDTESQGDYDDLTTM